MTPVVTVHIARVFLCSRYAGVDVDGFDVVSTGKAAIGTPPPHEDASVAAASLGPADPFEWCVHGAG